MAIIKQDYGSLIGGGSEGDYVKVVSFSSSTDYSSSYYSGYACNVSTTTAGWLPSATDSDSLIGADLSSVRNIAYIRVARVAQDSMSWNVNPTFTIKCGTSSWSDLKTLGTYQIQATGKTGNVGILIPINTSFRLLRLYPASASENNGQGWKIEIYEEM